MVVRLCKMEGQDIVTLRLWSRIQTWWTSLDELNLEGLCIEKGVCCMYCYIIDKKPLGLVLWDALPPNGTASTALHIGCALNAMIGMREITVCSTVSPGYGKWGHLRNRAVHLAIGWCLWLGYVTMNMNLFTCLRIPNLICGGRRKYNFEVLLYIMWVQATLKIPTYIRIGGASTKWWKALLMHCG